MKKLRNIVWLVLLMIVNFPVGYAYQMTYNPRVVCGERVLNLCIGGIGMILVLGGLCLIAYKYMKKKGHPDPAKRALIAYSVLTAGIMGLAMIGFEEAMFRKCGIIL